MKKDTNHIMHILLVEDEYTLLDGYAKILETIGFKVDKASNGKTALKKIMQNHYDLLITDILMPIMNGEKLILEVRKFNANLPIIISAAARLAYEGNSAIIKCDAYVISMNKNSFEEFLEKPWEPLVLIKTICRIPHLKKYLEEKHSEEVLKRLMSSKNSETT